MSINFIKGNLLDSNTRYICHQVNCQGKMNSGVAKAIRDKWPGVYEAYQTYTEPFIRVNNNLGLLGLCQYVDVDISEKTIINMFAQCGYGYDGKRYTSYDAFWTCLGNIQKHVPKGSTIAFPDHIGSCRGGANWEVIKTMIEQVLGEDYEVFIYVWEDK